MNLKRKNENKELNGIMTVTCSAPTTYLSFVTRYKNDYTKETSMYYNL